MTGSSARLAAVKAARNDDKYPIAPLKWEAPPPHKLAPAPGDFPHICGALNLDAVVDT